jgi:hypothetical protein
MMDDCHIPLVLNMESLHLLLEHYYLELETMPNLIMTADAGGFQLYTSMI